MIRRDMWPSGRDIEIGGGLHLHTVEEGSGPLVVFCHGFPELGYSWRHQLEPLVDAGYRVAIPDMLGFGSSSRPDEIEAYDVGTSPADLLGARRRARRGERGRSSATTGARASSGTSRAPIPSACARSPA